MTTAPSRIRYHMEALGGTVTRHGRLFISLGYSAEGLRSNSEGIDENYMYLLAASFLGWKHVQERSGVVIPSLPDRLSGCDFYWTVESDDSHYSPMEAVRGLVGATVEPSFSTDDWQFPFAIVGATYSSVTSQLAILGAAHELPQTSGGANSSLLDASPFFSRTIPTNAGDSRAIMRYYKSLGVTHMASLYIEDPWGRSYNADLRFAASEVGITLVSFSYDERNVEASLERLARSGMRHIFAILCCWQTVLEAAFDLGIIGQPDYFWIGAEMFDWKAKSLQFARNDPREMKLAQALRGVGSLELHVPQNDRFDRAMMDFSANQELQQEYIQSHADPSVFDNYTFPPPSGSNMQYLFYDAAYSLGIAACETPGLFTGKDMYQTLVNLEYQGASGNVSFDTVTGTRNSDTASFRIDNIQWSNERSDDKYIRFESKLAVMVARGQVKNLLPWIYFDNTTHAPPAIPPMDHNYNLIPMGVQTFGRLLGGMVMLLSLGLFCWTCARRDTFVVRASQPIFLCQLCIGTFVMAAAVIPMSLQGKEESRGLDIACMTIPWLVVVGFVIAFSSLFSKTWRLNKLMNSGKGMRRIKVEAVDVIRPFVVLMTLNVAMLLGWTLTSPRRYIRTEGNSFDEFGRSVDSNGRCNSENNKYLYFLLPILMLDFIGVATATYQCYVARDLPTEFSESSYLSLSMASLLESLFLGGPILFMVFDNPTAFYLVGSVLLCVCCLTILLPVFLPKYLRRNDTAPRSRGVVNSITQSRGSDNKRVQQQNRRL